MEQKYAMLAIDAALKAGVEILSIYNDPEADFEIERKADNSPLTIADRKAHKAIMSVLGDTPFPILSEEGKSIDYSVRKEWDTMWIVDPLDGTKEFIKRNGEFTVNIALVRRGSPVVGVIYVPVKKVLYFAIVGTGAYKCLGITELSGDMTWQSLVRQSVPMPSETGRGRFVVVASRSHLTPETEDYLNELKKRYGAIEMMSSGSSIKLCLVADGKADIYPRFAPTMEWDTAAGHAIVHAAGHEVYRAGTDEPLRYNKEDLLNPWFVCE